MYAKKPSHSMLILNSLMIGLLCSQSALAEHPLTQAPEVYNQFANQFEQQFNHQNGPVNWANAMQHKFFGQKDGAARYQGQQSGFQNGQQQGKTFNEMFGMGRGNTKLEFYMNAQFEMDMEMQARMNAYAQMQKMFNHNNRQYDQNQYNQNVYGYGAGQQSMPPSAYYQGGMSPVPGMNRGYLPQGNRQDNRQGNRNRPYIEPYRPIVR